MHKIVDLSKYDNAWYKPGRNKFVRFCWIFVSSLFVQSNWNPSSRIRIFFLRLFGAKIGCGVVIKPGVIIKYPWHLIVGDYVWIGEKVWIDNLTQVNIGNNVCISQGAYLLTGNHNFNDPIFGLIVKPIILQEGVWIGAKSIVCPGVHCFSHSVLTVASVASKDLPPYSICSGNPAIVVKERMIS